MRTWTTTVLFIFALHSVVAVAATGEKVGYEINGQAYEGYFVSPGKNAPLVLIIHDWDGLTDYEVKRAHMLADMGAMPCSPRTCSVRGFAPPRWRTSASIPVSSTRTAIRCAR